MKRKKIFIFLLPVLLLVSCTEKGLTPELELPPESSDTASEKLLEYNFTAKMPEGLEWKDSEAVAIYDGTAIRSFSIKETGGSVTLNGYASAESSSFQAVYPFSAAVVAESVPGSETEPSGKILGLKIPSVQTVGAGNDHDTSAMICSGTAVGDVITFAPAVSYLAIHVPEGVNSVSLKGLAYENVTGDSSAIVLDPSESVFTPGNYKIALLPMNFKTGFKLVYSKDGAISVVKFIPGQDKTAFVAGGVSDVTKRTAADAHVWLANPIMNEEQLLAYLNSQDAFASEVAKIGADISLTTNWTPVALTGTLDGQGHTISGLYVSASVDAGMFSSISEDAALKNITVEGNVTLAASRHPAKAGLVANLYGTMYKVVNRVNVSASSEKGACYLGGLAGLVSDGSLTECENAGTVALEKTSGKGYAGGIAGVVYPAGMVDKCNNAGTIKSSSANMGSIGGIIGLQQGGETKNCGNTGKIMVDAGFSTAAAGGVVGMLQNYSAKTLKLTGCTNEGEILLNAPSIQSVGGVVGALEDGAGDEPCDSEVSSCRNLSDISVKVGKKALSGGLDGFYLGGIVGRINASNDSAVLNTVKGCVNSGNISATLSDDAGANNAVKVGGICGNTRGQVNVSGNENAARSISLEISNAARLLCSVGGIIGEVGDPWESEDAEIALISNTNRANILSKTNNTETPAGGLVGYLFGPMRGSGNLNLGDVERAASDGSSPDVKSCFAGGFIGMANLSPEHRLPVHFNGDVTVGTIKSIGRAGIFFGGLRSGSRADFKFTNCIVGGRLISPYPGNYDIVMNDDNWDDMNRKGDGGYLWGYISGNYGLSLDGVSYGDAFTYDGASE
ncbi:MAG: hypothetical protein IJV32_05970 [Bacteroidales bacterium]|nr:hypothetical protein [Bacteroidales bacterium]